MTKRSVVGDYRMTTTDFENATSSLTSLFFLPFMLFLIIRNTLAGYLSSYFFRKLYFFCLSVCEVVEHVLIEVGFRRIGNTNVF